MGCYTQLYGIDIDDLRSFYGSGDQARLQSIVESKMEDIKDNDSRFEDEIEDEDWPMTIDAMAEILMGKCTASDSNAMYGYALEVICNHLGEHLNDDELGPLRNHPHQSLLLKTRSPVPIPLEDDFPAIGFLEAADVVAELEAIDRIGMPDDEEIAEDVQIYRDALAKAASKKIGVVSFYY